MGADQEQANLSSAEKGPTLSINPKFIIIGSVAAVLGIVSISGLSYKAGKSVNGSDVAPEERDFKLLEEEKSKFKEQVQNFEEERKQLELRANADRTLLEEVNEEKLKLEKQVQKFEEEREELEQRASAERTQLEEVKEELKEKVQQLESEREEVKKKLEERLKSANELLEKSLMGLHISLAKSPEALAFFKKNLAIFAQGLYSQDFEIVIQTLKVFDSFIFNDKTVQAKQSVIDLKIVPQIVSLLSCEFEAPLPVKNNIAIIASTILINISAGTREQASCAVEAGAVPILIKKAVHLNTSIRENAIWALSNIAAYYAPPTEAHTTNKEFRDIILENGILSNLLKAVEIEQSEPNFVLIRKSAHLLKNMFSQKLDALSWDTISPSISILEALLKSEKELTLEHATSALLYLTAHPNMVASEVSRFLDPINTIITTHNSNNVIKKNCEDIKKHLSST